ncbi:MAG TPA: hypothetical protein VIR33_14000, partial [Thermopolyspora sp.]
MSETRSSFNVSAPRTDDVPPDIDEDAPTGQIARVPPWPEPMPLPKRPPREIPPAQDDGWSFWDRPQRPASSEPAPLPGWEQAGPTA